MGLSHKTVQPITRDLEFIFPYQTTGRFPDLPINICFYLPGLPVIYRLQLPNYGDEFVQDLHLLPFSPEPATYMAAPAPEYSIFNCGYYITDFLKLQCQSEIGAILGIAQDHFL